VSGRGGRDAAARVVPDPARERYASGRGLMLLWFGFLGSAIAWLLHLVISYVLVLPACMYGIPIVIHAASLLLLGTALLSGWISYGSWQDLGRSTEDEEGGVVGRSRWMALSGMVAGGWFALVIVAQWIPAFMLSPCR
jgi:hypothetical protein